MLTEETKSKIGSIWNTMWSGGISNPLLVMEQLTYLLFIKRLAELEREIAEGRKELEGLLG